MLCKLFLRVLYVWHKNIDADTEFCYYKNQLGSYILNAVIKYVT